MPYPVGGTCLPPPEQTYCNTDIDCPPGFECQKPEIGCLCTPENGSNCRCPDPDEGVCVAKPPQPCETDKDCPNGFCPNPDDTVSGTTGGSGGWGSSGGPSGWGSSGGSGGWGSTGGGNSGGSTGGCGEQKMCVFPNCDDGTEVACDASRPICPGGETAAIQNGCWQCVDARTCEPKYTCTQEFPEGTYFFSKDPKECLSLMFRCPYPGYEGFFDESCGCGCKPTRPQFCDPRIKSLINQCPPDGTCEPYECPPCDPVNNSCALCAPGVCVYPDDTPGH